MSEGTVFAYTYQYVRTASTQSLQMVWVCARGMCPSAFKEPTSQTRFRCDFSFLFFLFDLCFVLVIRPRALLQFNLKQWGMPPSVVWRIATPTIGSNLLWQRLKRRGARETSALGKLVFAFHVDGRLPFVGSRLSISNWRRASCKLQMRMQLSTIDPKAGEC